MAASRTKKNAKNNKNVKDTPIPRKKDNPAPPEKASNASAAQKPKKVNFNLTTVANSNFGNYKEEESTESEVYTSVIEPPVIAIAKIETTDKKEYNAKKQTHKKLATKAEKAAVARKIPKILIPNNKVENKTNPIKIAVAGKSNQPKINLTSSKNKKEQTAKTTPTLDDKDYTPPDFSLFTTPEEQSDYLSRKYPMDSNIFYFDVPDFKYRARVNYSRKKNFKSRNFFNSEVTTTVSAVDQHKESEMYTITDRIVSQTLLDQFNKNEKNSKENKTVTKTKTPATSKSTPKNKRKTTPKNKKMNTNKRVKETRKQSPTLVALPQPILDSTKNDVFILNKEKQNIKFNTAELKEMLNLKEREFNTMPTEPRKINEASFSEVFEIRLSQTNNFQFTPSQNTVIAKIIPFNNFYNIDSFYKEILTLKTLKNENNCCKMEGYTVLTGKYTLPYLKAWGAYTKPSENANPANFGPDQYYGVIFMPNCGIPLETFDFHNTAEIFYFFKEICQTITNLENKYKFEHRDLHPGNILINRPENTSQNNVDFSTLQQQNKLFVTDKSYKPFSISIIDFSYSRIETDNMLIYTDLSNTNNKWLFEGDPKVDLQYQIYKDMATDTNEKWEAFSSVTNRLWIKHLAYKLRIKVEKQFNSPELKHFLDRIVFGCMLKSTTEGLLEMINRYFNREE